VANGTRRARFGLGRLGYLAAFDWTWASEQLMQTVVASSMWVSLANPYARPYTVHGVTACLRILSPLSEYLWKLFQGDVVNPCDFSSMFAGEKKRVLVRWCVLPSVYFTSIRPSIGAAKV
jgi:hypothetical protein